MLAVTGGLPDIVYKRTELRLFGTYGFSDNSSLRVDAAYQRLTYDDWGYAYGGTPFLYSDNSTVYLQPSRMSATSESATSTPGAERHPAVNRRPPARVSTEAAHDAASFLCPTHSAD